MNRLIIKDNKSNKYVVNDPNKFRKHLLNFHTSKGKANLSLHEENGHYFTATTNLLEEVNNFFKRNNK